MSVLGKEYYASESKSDMDKFDIQELDMHRSNDYRLAVHISRGKETSHVCANSAPVRAVQWYSTCVCVTVVQHLCVLYSGTAPVCAVQWYCTCVCCTVVPHMCVL